MRKFLYPWTDSPRKKFWRAWTAFWLIFAAICLTSPFWLEWYRSFAL